jgi:hypothetical protein
MRKGLSILFALFMLLSGAKFTIAMHFCGDKIEATKVSLSGKLASCGMESSKEISPSQGMHLTSHCCDNKVATIGIINNFTPPVSINTENTKNFQNIYYLPVSHLFYSNTASNVFYTSISPPGRFAVTSVDLDDICLSRI